MIGNQNRLNGHEDGFSERGIEAEMMDHHYALQYHIYLVGLLGMFRRAEFMILTIPRILAGLLSVCSRDRGVIHREGIFYDLPDADLLERLGAFFSESS